MLPSSTHPAAARSSEAVNREGNLGISAGVEDRAGAGVWVYQCDLFWREAVGSAGDLSGLPHAEDERHVLRATVQAAEREQGESERVVDARKEFLLVFEVVHRDQTLLHHQVL